MAKNETRRLAPSTLAQDTTALAALQSIATYQPANGDYTVAKLQSKLTALQAAQAAEAQASAALDAARDASVAAGWDFHKGVLGAKTQVIAQYGDDSAEVQSLGLKRTSEYKTRARAGGRAATPDKT